MSKRRIRVATLVAAFLILPGAAVADIGPMPPLPNAGAHPIPAEHAERVVEDWARDGIGSGSAWPDLPVDVAMHAEEVTIDLYPTFLVVDAWFDMVAGSQGADQLRVGFPESVPHFPNIPSDPKSPYWNKAFLQGIVAYYPLEFFSASVDGKPVAVSEQTDRELRTSDELQDVVTWLHAYDSWVVWPVSFAANQKRRVRVRYVQGLFGQGCVEMAKGSNQRGCSAQYVLRTGALWRGPIGSALLRVRLHGLTGQQVRVEQSGRKATGQFVRDRSNLPGKLNGPQVDESGITEFIWQHDTFEPEFDIIVTVLFDAKSFGALGDLQPHARPTYHEDLPQHLRLRDNWERLQRWGVRVMNEYAAQARARGEGAVDFETVWPEETLPGQRHAEALLQEIRATTQSPNEAARGYARALMADTASPWIHCANEPDRCQMREHDELCAAWLPDDVDFAWYAPHSRALNIASKLAGDHTRIRNVRNSRSLGAYHLCAGLGAVERRVAFAWWGALVAGVCLLAVGAFWFVRRRG